MKLFCFLIAFFGFVKVTINLQEKDVSNIMAEDFTLLKKDEHTTDEIEQPITENIVNNDRQNNLLQNDIKTPSLNDGMTSKYNGENVTESEKNNSKLGVVSCVSRVPEGNPAVKIVNNSVLLSIIVPESNITANECVLILFYAPWCYFSAAAAPHYNAIARVFPSIHVLAVNAVKYNNLNTRYSVVAVPTLLLFHNGRPICKYNETTYTLEKLVTFVNKHTGLSPLGLVNVTSADFEGPLPSEVVQETDYIFWISCAFILACCGLGFAKSSLCHYILESIHSNWQEAEAQHEHAE